MFEVQWLAGQLNCKAEILWMWVWNPSRFAYLDAMLVFDSYYIFIYFLCLIVEIFLTVWLDKVLNIAVRILVFIIWKISTIFLKLHQFFFSFQSLFCKTE